MLEGVFGKASVEYLEFSQLRFELSPVHALQAEHQAGEHFRQLTNVPSFEHISFDTHRYYRSRLDEASEILLGCILKLRSCR